MPFFAVSFLEDPFSTGRFKANGEPIRLYDRLAEAKAAAIAPGEPQPPGRVFVIDEEYVELEKGSGLATHTIPEEAVLNRNPYRRPTPIDAGGGYVVRERHGELELLLIFRRGRWDLPKGKQDDESIEECALREVAEEVGIEQNELRIIAELGPTVHGYSRSTKETFVVKTTHWYAITTTATSFTPQTSEDIEKVVWAPWGEAGRRLGFPNLRKHHAAIDPRWLLTLLTNE